ncbi:hypothetical protein EUGRSUZ_F00128 [Eucalyptus grandis]|uniref:Uncharacterized protein n=2 Tax=Eucalyptus grandis TaxID=71139 RepID=A0ACC3KB36_EUCGR|nr:hypothetical protein EUGRSUZ_F00128 [Eucalyptus grandis]
MFSVIFHIHNCFPRAALIIKREHITTEIKAERSKWKQDMLQRLAVEASSSCPVEATGGVQSLLELVASSMTSPPGIREIASIASPPCRTKLTNRRVSSSKES